MAPERRVSLRAAAPPQLPNGHEDAGVRDGFVACNDALFAHEGLGNEDAVMHFGNLAECLKPENCFRSQGACVMVGEC